MKNFILTCLMLACFVCRLSAQTNESDTLPHGVWKVERVAIERTIEGGLQTDANSTASNVTTRATTTLEFNSVEEVKSRVTCPQEWIINKKNIVLRYPNDVEATIENTMEDNRLTIYSYDGMKQVYQCSTIDGSIVMTITHQYINILDGKQGYKTRELQNVTEKWVITLKKSGKNE